LTRSVNMIIIYSLYSTQQCEIAHRHPPPNSTPFPYTTLFRSQEPSLPELPIQYADFTLWERQLLKADALEKQIAYWKRSASPGRSEEHTSELQSHLNIVCRLLLEEKYIVY